MKSMAPTGAEPTQLEPRWAPFRPHPRGDRVEGPARCLRVASSHKKAGILSVLHKCPCPGLPGGGSSAPGAQSKLALLSDDPARPAAHQAALPVPSLEAPRGWGPHKEQLKQRRRGHRETMGHVPSALSPQQRVNGGDPHRPLSRSAPVPSSPWPPAPGLDLGRSQHPANAVG